MIALDRYPRKGEKIRAEVIGKHGIKIVVGKFTGKVFKVKSGAAFGTIDTGTGQANVPWTTNRNKIIFYGENSDNYYLEDGHITEEERRLP